ncbi:glycolipid transfer protein domain-containing protein [Pelagophyceae sp. CCMP2097]|nr:glycolipid transfer protein domain-containing protein [Pelagophyceae sp. CCMP2097]
MRYPKLASRPGRGVVAAYDGNSVAGYDGNSEEDLALARARARLNKAKNSDVSLSQLEGAHFAPEPDAREPGGCGRFVKWVVFALVVLAAGFFALNEAHVAHVHTPAQPNASAALAQPAQDGAAPDAEPTDGGRLRGKAAGAAAGAAVTAPVPAALAPAAPAVDSLRLAAVHFEAAILNTADDIVGKDFLAATIALYPWLDALGCGLQPMVHTNVVKLQTRGAEDLYLASMISGEVERRTSDKDDSAAVAALWNGRVLLLMARIADDLLASEAMDANNKAESLVDLVKGAYVATLAQHHNRFVKSAAFALLRFAPSRTDLFEKKLGYPKSQWSTTLKGDLQRFAAALQPCLRRLSTALEPAGFAL